MNHQYSHHVFVYAATLAIIAGVVSAQPVGHDFNADGVPDYLAAITNYDENVPSAGAARMWSGASKTIIDTILSSDANTLFGWSIASVGDLNNDGFDDIAVGEPLWGTPDAWEGRVHVFSGNDSSLIFTVTAPYPETGLGRYVAGVGDWDGDGIPDIATSGWVVVDVNGDGTPDDAFGIVFVFSGADGSTLAEITDIQATERFGYSIFGLGDVTGDGLADIAIVDRRADGAEGTGAIGRIYVFGGMNQPGTLSFDDALYTIKNSDPTLRGFGAQIDAMHPDLWLDHATIQIVSLTDAGIGGVNEAESAFDIFQLDGTLVGTKGVRPSLVLAGDVNLDGQVTVDDLLESINQLGTDPGQTGVMPITDVNKDGVIDQLDVALILEQYGQATDVFEGLWDPSRLWSIAGGSAGFGGLPGAISPIGPGGPRPLDDCLFLTAGPDDGISPIPYLLDLDQRTNCRSCPRCIEDPDCFACLTLGQFSGGSISVDNSQPKPDECATFSISPVRISGAKVKCVSACGDEGTVCELDPEEYAPSWEMDLKLGDNDWIMGWRKSANGDSLTVCGSQVGACAEVRLRRLEQVRTPPIPAGWCEEIRLAERDREIQFAPFTLTSETLVAAPDGTPSTRTTVGIGERVKVEVVEAGAGDTKWHIEGSGAMPVTSPVFWFDAPKEKSAVVVVAEINGCVRKREFDVIEPSSVNYTPCEGTVVHWEGLRHVQFQLKMDFDPDHVSFYKVESHEVSGPGTGGTGDFAGNEPYHNANDSVWLSTYNSNEIAAVDNAKIGPWPSGDTRTGFWKWEIPRDYRVPGGPIHRLDEFTVQLFRVQVNCVTVAKGGMEATGCIDGPGVDQTGWCVFNLGQ